MIKKVFKIPRFVIRVITKKLNQVFRKKTLDVVSELYKYKIFTLKDATYEKTVIIKTFKLREEGHVNLYHDSVNAYLLPSGFLIPENDFVIVDNLALYKKVKHPLFGSTRTQDRNVIKFHNGKIDIVWPKKTMHIKYGLNLCGTNSNVWSHFIVQFLPKLYYLERLRDWIPENEKLAILLDDCCDKQVIEIIQDYISDFSFAYIKLVNLNCLVQCDYLFHIDNVSFISDFDAITTNSDIVIPRIVADLLKKNLCDHYSFSKNSMYNKLFITRKPGFRNITNYLEVENFFLKKGYHLFDPGKVSLREKIEAFKNASYVVGPSSSGFSNLIFCSKTKVLRMSNSQRINDGYVPFILENWDIDGVCMIGKDIDPRNSHTSYEIDINELEELCRMEGF